jgi:hypothetical protein
MPLNFVIIPIQKHVMITRNRTKREPGQHEELQVGSHNK